MNDIVKYFKRTSQHITAACSSILFHHVLMVSQRTVDQGGLLKGEEG